MLETIKEFIMSIGDAIMTAWDFVIDFFSDIAYITKLVLKFFGNIPTYLSFLPAPLLSIIVVGFSVVVIYKITGREG